MCRVMQHCVSFHIPQRHVRSSLQKRCLHLFHCTEITCAGQHQRRLTRIIFPVHVCPKTDGCLHHHIDHAVPPGASAVKGSARQAQKAVALIIQAAVRVESVLRQKLHQLFSQSVPIKVLGRVQHDLWAEQRHNGLFAAPFL